MNTFVMNGSIMNGSHTVEPYLGAYARKSYFAEPGVNNYVPNVRATSIIIVVENERAGVDWAIEGISATARDAGRRR